MPSASAGLTPLRTTLERSLHPPTNNLISDKFGLCTALILDHGQGALLAHAVPSDDVGVLETLYFTSDIFTGNAVEKSVEELARRGIPTRNVKAIVHAGEGKGLDRIIDDLHQREIKISYIHLEPERSFRHRSIEYNPLNDNLNVEFTPYPIQ